MKKEEYITDFECTEYCEIEFNGSTLNVPITSSRVYHLKSNEDDLISHCIFEGKLYTAQQFERVKKLKAFL